MGRLQRKKPLSKKKKKKQGVNSSEMTESAAANNGSKIVSLSDFSINKKKQSVPGKKPQAAARPVKTEPGHLDKAIQFLREVRVELKKVTWPSRTQTIGSTAVVIILVVIISFFLGIIDFGLMRLVQFILH